MGTTLTTLHLYNMKKDAVLPFLAPTDQLRDQNPPWLSIVPSHDTDKDVYKRLRGIAMRLTKEKGSPALLFLYYDDVSFNCTLYQNGRKSISCDNDQPWAKLGKKLSELFEDNLPSRAFRYASHCSNMEEQLKLMEETAGTALYDLQEEEPRIVPRCDKTLQEIRAREAMLRKRPNRYTLTEIPEEDWPDGLRYRQKLLMCLRYRWSTYNLISLLWDTDMERYLVPGTEALIAYPYTLDRNLGYGRVFLMDGRTGENWTLSSFSGMVDRAVWQTKSGGIVLLLSEVIQSEADRRKNRSPYCVICLNRNRTEEWRFSPDLNRQRIQHIHSSEHGVITLFAPGIDASVKADAVMWQIDAETGKLLRTRSFSYEDGVYHVLYSGTVNGFLLCRRSKKELVLLDDTLEDVRVIENYNGDYNFKKDKVCGSILWEGDCWNERYVTLWDLQNGESRTVRLEIPAYPLAVLPDGRIFSVNDKANKLTVFDKEGTVTARCSVPGSIKNIFTMNGDVYLAEVRGTIPCVLDDYVFDETSTYVWRLDPV